jgi:hypothetical protein
MIHTVWLSSDILINYLFFRVIRLSICQQLSIGTPKTNYPTSNALDPLIRTSIYSVEHAEVYRNLQLICPASFQLTLVVAILFVTCIQIPKYSPAVT